MSRRMPDGLINEIRSKVDLVDLVSKHLSLNKKGNNYWGICPFHQDSNPSLSVAADKQIYKCFTCGAGGNAFTFLQNINNISFMEAVEILAEEAHIDVSQYVTRNVKPVDPEKEKLYEIMAEVGQFAAYQLNSEMGQEARDILRKREYDLELLETFGVGVVFSDNQMTRFLKAKGYKDEDLIKADVSRWHQETLKDVFYNRILFPIHDAYGRIIAFSGRTMDPYSKVKYINTSETKLYTKGHVIYNFHRAKDHARKEGYVLVSEGVTDTMAFHKAGLKQTVSLLGVACTPDQIRLLKQCSSTIVLAFDADRAGIEATYKIGNALRAQGLKVYVWYNDTGLDPDDALRQHGAQSLIDGVEHRLHWFDFIMNFAISQYGLESFENKKRVSEFVLKQLEHADEFEKSHYTEVLSQRTQFDIGMIRSQITQANHHEEVIHEQLQVRQKPKKAHKQMVMAEGNILSLMLHSKQAAILYRDQLGFMHSPLANQLAMVILDAYRSFDTIEIADILSKNISDELRDFAIDIGSEVYLDEYDEAVLLEQIAIVKAQMSMHGIQNLKSQSLGMVDLEDSTNNLQKAIELSRRKKEGH